MDEIVSYKPLIEDMVWSFSRIEAFEDCPYRWQLKYIDKNRECEMFYSNYGRLIHKIIELYYKGELPKEKMNEYFLTHFKDIEGERPKESTVNNMIKEGVDYCRTFEPFPYNMVGVEHKAKFEIDGIKFIGFIDFLGEKDGEYYIVDNKSRKMKHRSNRPTPTIKDAELDQKLRQLYLYSAYVEKEYGKTPKALCFNCFRNREFIVEPFDENKYAEVKQWAVDTIHKIEDTTEFNANRDPFVCKWICGLHDICKYDIEAKEEWIRKKREEENCVLI